MVPVENREPTAIAAMDRPFHFDFNLHFDWEMTAGAVESQGHSKVPSRSSGTKGGNGDDHAFDFDSNSRFDCLAYLSGTEAQSITILMVSVPPY